MEKNKLVILITNFNVFKAANGDNVLSYYRIFRKLGYFCSIISFDTSIQDNKNINYDDITIRQYGMKSILSSYFLRKKERKNKVEIAFHENESLLKNTTIVFYFGNYDSKIYQTIELYQKKYKYRVITQVCEWYTLSRVVKNVTSIRSFLESIKAFIVHIYARNFVFKKDTNIITVSKLMFLMFMNKKCNCLFVPNLYSIASFREKEINKPLKIGYFGDPGYHNSKDLLINICRGIALQKEKLQGNFELHVYGVNKEALIERYDFTEDLISEIEKIVFFHGRIDKKIVTEKIEAMDFTALLRKDLKSLNMGLSSKMVESMAHGRPMITNLTSNMSDYISDGINGIVVENETPEAFSSALLRILSLSTDKIKKIQSNSYNSAITNFDWHSYVQVFADYIETLK